MKDTYGVKTSYDKEALFSRADVVILAMKPKDLKDSLLTISPLYKRKSAHHFRFGRCNDGNDRRNAQQESSCYSDDA